MIMPAVVNTNITHVRVMKQCCSCRLQCVTSGMVHQLHRLDSTIAMPIPATSAPSLMVLQLYARDVYTHTKSSCHSGCAGTVVMTVLWHKYIIMIIDASISDQQSENQKSKWLKRLV